MDDGQTRVGVGQSSDVQAGTTASVPVPEKLDWLTRKNRKSRDNRAGEKDKGDERHDCLVRQAWAGVAQGSGQGD